MTSLPHLHCPHPVRVTSVSHGEQRSSFLLGHLSSDIFQPSPQTDPFKTKSDHVSQIISPNVFQKHLVLFWEKPKFPWRPTGACPFSSLLPYGTHLLWLFPLACSSPALQIPLLLFKCPRHGAAPGPLHLRFSLLDTPQRVSLSLSPALGLFLSETFSNHTIYFYFIFFQPHSLKLKSFTSIPELCIYVPCIIFLHNTYRYLIDYVFSTYLFIDCFLN